MTDHIVGKRSLTLLTLFLLIAISFPAVSQAQCKATLAWGDACPGIEGYYVFGREEGEDYDYDTPWWEGDSTFTECVVENLEPDKTYYFVIRAYAGNDVSADSNEVRFSNLVDEESGSGSDSGYGSDSGSDSLSYGVTSDSARSSFRGSSGSCFIGSLLDAE